MKKATIKRLLAVVVGVLIIAASLTAGFGTLAETPAYYGTAEDGFSSVLSSWPVRLAPTDKAYNLDFEEGFVYWSGEKYQSAANTNVLASDNFKLVEESGNKYITLKETGFVKTIQTAYITVSNVAVGDKLVLVYDAKGADAKLLRPYLRQDGLRPVEYGTDGMSTTLNPNGSGSIWNPSAGNAANIIPTDVEPTEFGAQLAAEGWTTYVTAVSKEIKASTELTSSAKEDIYLQLVISKDANASGSFDAAIDNIRIVKVTGEEGNEVYTDITTEEVIYPEPKYPAYFGTEADGLDSNLTHYPMQLTPADDIYNLDFSDGFCCWGGKALAGAGDVASSAFDIVTEANGNKYAKVKEDGYVSNISTVLFKAKNVQAGDNLVVIYDVKGADGFKVRIKLVQEFLKEIAVYDKKTGLNTTMKADGSALINCCPGVPAVPVGTSMENAEFSVQTEAEGWTTLIAETSQAILDPKSSTAAAATKDTLRDDIFLQVVVTCPSEAGVVAGDILDAAVDNIRIAKVVDGQYIDIATNEVIDAGSNGNGGTGNEGTGNEGNGGNGSATTGDSVLALAALFFISGAAVFGTAKAMKNR